jgi:hypothetical protein
LVSIQFISGTDNKMSSFVEGSGAAHGGAVAGTLLAANTPTRRQLGTSITMWCSRAI